MHLEKKESMSSPALVMHESLRNIMAGASGYNCAAKRVRD